MARKYLKKSLKKIYITALNILRNKPVNLGLLIGGSSTSTSSIRMGPRVGGIAIVTTRILVISKTPLIVGFGEDQ